MKKRCLQIIIMLLSMTFVFGLASCGKDVEFNVNFVVDGEVYATVGTSGNETIRIPENPSKDGYIFDGWYWDSDTWQKPFTANSLLDAPLSSDMSVYAKWKENAETHTHLASDWIIDKDATCKETGSKHKECTVCEEVLETATIDKLTTHTPGEAKTENFVDSDCETEGSYNSVVYCSVCNTKLSSEAKTVGKKPHTPSDWITDIDATCKDTGSKHKECTKCEEVLETSAIERTEDHIPTTDNKIEPTDTTDGLTEGSHCSLCEKILVAQNVIPALLQGTDIKSGLLNVSDEKIIGSVSNVTETFSFLNDITVSKDANYIVARDIYCENIIHSKTVPLSIGDNTFYILVTNGKEMKLYAVTIRRLPMYIVSFRTNNGTTIESQTVEEGSKIKIPNTFVEGYEFDGWNIDVTQPIVQNVEIIGKWSPIAYTITYLDTFNSLNSNPTTFTIESEKIELTSISRSGYAFEGWYDENDLQITEIDPQIISNLKITAKWKLLTYNISYTFDLVNENPNQIFSYTVLDSDIVLQPLTCIGYEFLGWFELGNKEATETIISERACDITLTAVWKPISYKINYVYDTQIGSYPDQSNPTEYNVESAIVLSDLYNPQGWYSFDGWFLDEDFSEESIISEIQVGTVGNITIYAKWKINIFCLTYINATETNNNPNTYTALDETFTLQNLEKEGHVFDGWYLDDKYANKLNSLEKGTTGDITLYAKWLKIINTAEELKSIEFDGLYILNSDIDLTDTQWSTIGYHYNAPQPFTGEINGNGHVIKNINRTFIAHNSGCIKNIGFEDFEVNVSGSQGIVSNKNTGSITNVYVTNGTIQIHATYDGPTEHYIGIFVVDNQGLIEKCFSSCSLIVQENTYYLREAFVAGIACKNSSNGIIRNCYSTSNINLKNEGTQNRSMSAGGIAYENYGLIQSCYFAGSIYLEGRNYDPVYEDPRNGRECAASGAGIAIDGSGKINNCFVTGSIYVDANAGQYGVPFARAAGISIFGSVTNCYSSLRPTLHARGNTTYGIVKNGTVVSGDNLTPTPLDKILSTDFLTNKLLWSSDDWSFEEGTIPELKKQAY